MSVSNRVLLVEGEGDKEFIQHLICTLKLDIKIMPETPRDICNTQSDGIDVLRTRALPFVLDRIRTENITHLGIIIDADSSNDGYGFEKRRKQITDILIARGYEIPAFTANINQGEIFPTNKEDWPPIGLWIMPTHSTDGMLEDLLLDNLENPTQQSLLNKVDAAIRDLGDLQAFKETHLSKARLSTLLSWQKKPGMSAGKAYQAKVFDTNPKTSTIIPFTAWLTRVFQ